VGDQDDHTDLEVSLSSPITDDDIRMAATATKFNSNVDQILKIYSPDPV
jgi:hypothetical protein